MLMVVVGGGGLQTDSVLVVCLTLTEITVTGLGFRRMAIFCREGKKNGAAAAVWQS